ncbi:hypothetical protein BN14_03006 [Rhizoctonia solani AG-1 IB]|uniref:Uncharacterized protein n=1 Tax=Thanatephorus cucumeris (strain AG1-IB / isolate 7/3/14) TaxID=1108050 RepID=M5BPF0_THACB|nr:hypothetical protein BN14_03006 [Rhizoctonia solani AG-1 IB]
MSVNKPNLMDNPEPEAHPANGGGGDDHPSDANTKSNIQPTSNLSSSAGGNLNPGADCTKCSMTSQSLSPLTQFQSYGGINGD